MPAQAEVKLTDPHHQVLLQEAVLPATVVVLPVTEAAPVRQLQNLIRTLLQSHILLQRQDPIQIDPTKRIPILRMHIS